MRDIIQNWQGTDAELLAELNAPTIKVVDKSFGTVRDLVKKMSAEFGWDKGAEEKLLSIGVKTHSPAFASLGRDATQEDIDNYRAVFDQEALEQKWAEQQNELVNIAIATGDKAKLVAALRAAADELEGG